jgi:type IV pilus assembly protein PilA
MPTIAVVAIVGGVLFVIVIVIGILAAIAIPNYLRFNAKAKQSEAKVNLGSIFVAEIAYFGENNHYADNFDHLEWQPEGLHYAYFLPGQDLQPRDGLAFKIPPDEPEARPMVTVDAFKVVAVGNIDNDETLDVWVIDQNKNLRNLVDDTRQ